VALQLCYSGVTVALQGCCRGVAVVFGDDRRAQEPDSSGNGDNVIQYKCQIGVVMVTVWYRITVR
jgi:hypothetical protein